LELGTGLADAEADGLVPGLGPLVEDALAELITPGFVQAA
jgi:hypothetical protein